jgi:predicted RNA-binding protein Jag
MIINDKQIKNNEEQSRIGVKWMPEEDAKLELEINEKKSYEEIALEHKRTILGIKLRVIHKIIYPKYKNNIDINDLSIEYNIDIEYLQKILNNIDIKNTIKNNKITAKENKITVKENKQELLENRLIGIEQKLDYIISILSK